MRIAIIGAGNVGGLAGVRIAEAGLGDVVLIDVVKGLAAGKACDAQDAQALVRRPYRLTGSEHVRDAASSDVIVITAGLARKPGMTREDLLQKNAAILKTICNEIRGAAPHTVVIVVTNPLDVMTRYVREVTGFTPQRVIGMGASLDASRFANLIADELAIAVTRIEPCVIGCHGEGMMPLPRHTRIDGVPLTEMCSTAKVEMLIERTIDRGREIVSLLGSGSAFCAPSAAIADLVAAVVKDEQRIIGVSAGTNGEYGIKGVSIGLPCRIGRAGIERIIELDLDAGERARLLQGAASLSEQYRLIAQAA